MQINCYFLYDYGNTVLILIFFFFSDALYTFSRPLEAGKLAGFRKKESICIRATSVLWAIKSASVNRFPLRIFRAAISLRKIHPSYWLEHRTFNIEFLFRTREFTALGCYPKPSEIWWCSRTRDNFAPHFYFSVSAFIPFSFHCLRMLNLHQRDWRPQVTKADTRQFSPFFVVVVLLFLLLLFFQNITLFRNL